MSVELPLTLVRSVSRTLITATAASTSPFTGTQQVQDWGGEWWEYEFEFGTVQGLNARRLSAFFAALGGMRGTFIFRDPAIQNPTGLGTPLVNGANQTGNSLITDGWSATGMKAGDFIQLGAASTIRLHQVTADFTPSGGNATLAIIPKLRSSPADNATITVASPGVLLRLTSPVPAIVGRVDKYQFTIRVREAI